MTKLEKIKETIFLRSFTWLKIPLIWWLRPSVEEVSDSRVVIKIPLSKRSKNHLNVMYFGALAIGAELAIAYVPTKEIATKRLKVSLLFKDFAGAFNKRADGDVHFVCDQISEVREMLETAKNSSERQTKMFEAYAIVPAKSTTEKIAEFKLSLSLKKIEGKNKA